MSKNRVFTFICVAILALAGGLFLTHPKGKQPLTATPVMLYGYKNATYVIEGENVTLKNGNAEKVDPISAATTTVSYFGNEATGDINQDGKDDTAFIVKVTSGGSGTFYYLVAALKTNDSYAGTNALFLGDRIAPMSTQIKDGMIIANYAVRKENEPMAQAPSVSTTTYAQIIKGELVLKR